MIEDSSQTDRYIIFEVTLVVLTVAAASDGRRTGSECLDVAPAHCIIGKKVAKRSRTGSDLAFCLDRFVWKVVSFSASQGEERV